MAATTTPNMSAVSVQQPTTAGDDELLLRSLLHYVNSTDIAVPEQQPRVMTQRDSEFFQTLAKDIFWGFDDEDTNTDGIDWAVIWQILQQRPSLELSSDTPEIAYPQQTAVSS
jgi:hypothetical protein